jgi:nucleoside-diphosphate-sugar epimerase
MKVLFVGGSGNISTACARLAVERGIELHVFNRGLRRVNLPESVVRIAGDCSDAPGMKRALAGHRFDAVVNFVVYDTGQAERDIELFAGRTKQYVFISSATVYQKPPRHYLITEETPLGNPFWDYAQKKIAAEGVLMQAFRERGFPVTIVRPSFTYGDEWIPTSMSIDYTPVARLRRGLPLVVHGDGTSLWVMTHASDFAQGLIGLLGCEGAIGQAVHITSDEVLTWNQVYETIARIVGVEPGLVHIPSDFIARVNPQVGCGLLGDKAHSAVFDNSKIKRLVPGFRCSVLFAQGIARTIAYLDTHPDKQSTARNAAIEEILQAWRSGSGR